MNTVEGAILFIYAPCRSKARGVGQVLGLRNTSTSIIAFLTFQSRIHMLADRAPRPNVHTLSHGRALYCIRAPGMTRTYVAKEPYGGLGLIDGFHDLVLQVIAAFPEDCQHA